MSDQPVLRLADQDHAVFDAPHAGSTGPRPSTGVVRSVLDLPRLPVSLTSFIGRADIAGTIVELVLQPDTRLLTLTGPGGVGKTRLALKVAGDYRASFADGVGFISLAAVRDPAQVLPTIAHCLGLRSGDRTWRMERVQAHLTGRHCLLVLDNFEQVVDAGPVLTHLLNGASGVRLLVTSRTPLRVSGERVVPIPPMTLAAPGTEAEVIESEAVQLFLDRAAAVRLDITATEAATPAIAEICARLDGLPLAIELAAAKTRFASPPVLRNQITQRLTLLTSGPRDQPERLQTMRAAIGWSYDLLGAASQALFRCLSVFAGGFSLDAAAAICQQDTPVILTGLEELVDHSLVQADTEVGDEPRYRMLETIREFGHEHLVASGEMAQVHERHADYFLTLVERIGHEVDGPEAGARLARLDVERPNLQVAVAWLIEQEEAERAMRLAAALWRYWRIRGYLEEGHDTLVAAVALERDAPPATRADALWKLGYLLFFLGQYKAARDRLEQSVALFIEAGDRAGEATARDSLGTILLQQGESEQAKSCHERALAIRQELGDRFEMGVTLANLGRIALHRGELGGARTLLEEALTIARESGSRREFGHRCLNLSQVEIAEENLTAAQALVERALAIFKELGEQVAIADALEVLGQIASEPGDDALGVDLLLASLRLRLRLGLYRNLGDFIERLARVIVPLDAALAARCMGAAAADRETSGIDRLPWDGAAWSRTVATAQAALGGDGFDTAWRTGHGLTVIAAAHEAEVALAGLAATRPLEAADALVTGSATGFAHGLTPRELEILRLVAAGHSNRVIAEALFISPATVKRHVTNILAKLHATTRAAAISHALHVGLVDD